MDFLKASIQSKFVSLLVVLTLVQIPFAPLQATASDIKTMEKGERLLRRHCARCHSVGARGEGPHSAAPAFRDISKNYPVESLAESLAEGILTGHPDMPVFYFQANEVDQIIAYLKSIQHQ